MKSISEEKLFSKINHDLRGSFVSILGYSSLLSDPNEKITDDEMIEFTSRIDHRAKETYELLESFTNWLKLERYPNSINNEEINLLESITSAQSLFKSEFTKKNINVEFAVNKTILVLFDLSIIQTLLKNMFLFISKNIKENSKLKIFTALENSTTLQFEFYSFLSEAEILPLTNLETEISLVNIPNEILLSKRITELSGGNFKLIAFNEKKITIVIQFNSQN